MPIIGVTGSQNTKGFLQPNAPTIGTATDVGTGRAFNNGAATVTFTPAASGAAATSYTATSSPGGFTGTSSSSPITVTGLQSNTAYTFTVTGTNAAGTGAASAASGSMTATTVPGVPTSVSSAKNTSSIGSISVSYSAPASNGGKAITSYTATSSPSSVTGSGGSPIAVTGLTQGSYYTFTVTATNANGTSSASSASSSTQASLYVCSAGSLSGSTCSYGATANTGWACIYGPYGWTPAQAYANGWSISNSTCNMTGGSPNWYRCGWGAPGIGTAVECGQQTTYSCPSGGSLSGGTCSFSASIA